MAEELDPNKYHILSNKQRQSIIIIFILVALIILPVTSFFYYKFATERPAQTDKEMGFTIPSGSSIIEIAAKLEEEKLVNSAFLFKLYIFINKFDKNIQAGEYKIPAGISVVQLVDLFGHGVNDITITFLEGWRVEQYALTASAVFKKVDYNQFIQIAGKSEGYLFPDTYSFPTEATEENIIKALVDNFETKTKDLLTEENLKKVELTKDQVITFASIVEREIKNPEDRPVVAGILIKRWRNNELIGADATTQYTIAKPRYCSTADEKCPNFELAKNIDWWPSELTKENLETDSPYNTRKNVGLPPTPISNPSVSAIEAILNYTESPYNFYLTDKKGTTHFSKTLNEHNINVYKYLFLKS